MLRLGDLVVNRNPSAVMTGDNDTIGTKNASVFNVCTSLPDVTVLEVEHNQVNNRSKSIMEFDKDSTWSQVYEKEETIAPSKSFVFYTGGIMVIAGAGLYFATVILRSITRNPLLRGKPELLKIIPLLLGLKGSIDMTYASRLSTMSNTNRLPTIASVIQFAFYNLALNICQAVNITLCAAGFILMICIAVGVQLNSQRIAMFLLVVLYTAMIASCFLAVLITGLVYLSSKLPVDPDDICSPFAAAAGDSSVLMIITIIGTFVYTNSFSELASWIGVGLVLAIGAICMLIAMKNPETKEALFHGSLSTILSMLIGLGVGVLFQNSLEKYESVTLYQLILNGIGGNLVAILASRTSTFLHKLTPPQKALAQKQWIFYLNPFYMWKDKKNFTVMALLIGIGFVIQVVEMLIIYFTSSKAINHPTFTFTYLFLSVSQILILFYACMLLTRFFFASGINPDNNSIPLLTALGDLIGTVFLSFCFSLYRKVLNASSV